MKSLQPTRILTYSIGWLIISVIHWLFLTLAFNIPFLEAITDALFFNLLFALMGIGLWYVTRFFNLEKRRITDILINHLTFAVIMIAIWISLSFYILRAIFTDPTYLNFLENSIPVRIMTGILFYTLLTGFYYLIQNLEILSWQVKQKETIMHQLKDAEIKALRSQINPHFLFNSLNSVHALTLTSPEKAGEMIIKLSELMRYSLSKPETSVTLEEEIAQVKRYLDIEKIRFSERLNISFDYSESEMKLQVPSMILQPLIENAVKHGIYGLTGKVNIDLHIIMEKNYLKISLSNNFDPETPAKKGTGTGLNNVKERLATLYHRGDLVAININENIFTVTLKIPLYEKI